MLEQLIVRSNRSFQEGRLLLHFDGDFSDVNGHVPVIGGNPIISSDAKFGTGALAKTANTDFIRFAGDDLILNADFTVEWWIKKTTSLNSLNKFFEASVGIGVVFRPTGELQLYGNNDVLLGATTPNFNTSGYYHIAVTRTGNTWRCFINGQVRITATSTAGATTGNIILLNSRANNGTNGFIMDEFRLINGTSLYQANFNPPTAPFES